MDKVEVLALTMNDTDSTFYVVRFISDDGDTDWGFYQHQVAAERAADRLRKELGEVTDATS